MNEVTIFYIIIGFLFSLLVFLILIKNHIEPQRNELINQDLVPDEKIKNKTYYSKKYGLTGKPDEVRNISGEIIPVEVKSTLYKGRIYPSHILQVAAYCLLIEEDTGRRPPYGIIKYKDHEETVYYTKELQRNLLTQIKLIRQENPEENDLPPICEDQRKCRHCGYNYKCHTGQKRLL